MPITIVLQQTPKDLPDIFQSNKLQWNFKFFTSGFLNF